MYVCGLSLVWVSVYVCGLPLALFHVELKVLA
jgi:hypothetical protein